MNIKQIFLLLSVIALMAGCSDGDGSSLSAAENTFSSSSETSASNLETGFSSSNTDLVISHGEFTDERDGQVYKTVVIGTQTWMAQNLNYADNYSSCYENSADSCSKYGRLYGSKTILSAKYTNACPNGWHIPREVEWTTLETTIGGSSTAGTKLKSTRGWNDDGNGTDIYGFTILPAGFYYQVSGESYGVGNSAYFWSATQDLGGYYIQHLSYDSGCIYTNGYDGGSAAVSIRCVKDAE